MKRIAAAALPLLLAGCLVGPDYKRPAMPAPPAYKEIGDWRPASPRDAIPKGPWWSVFDDPLLDSLERQVVISNQNVKASEAAYRAAVDLVREAQANLFPTASGGPTVTRQSLNSSASFAGGGTGTHLVGKAATLYSLQGSGTWTLDVWGRIRRQIESQQAAAQVSAADLANALLSEQATLATDYFDLRAEDSLTRLLTDTAAAFQHSLQITINQYNAGTASRGDVVTADAQLKTVQAQLVGVGVQRAQFEHAIAVLTGHAPSELTIPPAPMPNDVPVVPAGVPSTLLERRPDIAAAERTVAEQNAQIGVAIGAFYPDISLSGTFGFAGAPPLTSLFTVANRVWSLGAAGTETLLDGGQRLAALATARDTYDQDVAAYRQTVLSAFQSVEDELAALRILEQQAAAEAAAVAASQKAVDVALNEYQAGTVAYTTVITEQETLLTDQQSALSVQQSRLVAAVALIEDLGGGWRTGDLPGNVPLNPAAVLLP